MSAGVAVVDGARRRSSSSLQTNGDSAPSHETEKFQPAPLAGGLADVGSSIASAASEPVVAGSVVVSKEAETPEVLDSKKELPANVDGLLLRNSRISESMDRAGGCFVRCLKLITVVPFKFMWGHIVGFIDSYVSKKTEPGAERSVDEAVKKKETDLVDEAVKKKETDPKALYVALSDFEISEEDRPQFTILFKTLDAFIAKLQEAHPTEVEARFKKALPILVTEQGTLHKVLNDMIVQLNRPVRLRKGEKMDLEQLEAAKIRKAVINLIARADKEEKVAARRSKSEARSAQLA